MISGVGGGGGGGVGGWVVVGEPLLTNVILLGSQALEIEVLPPSAERPALGQASGKLLPGQIPVKGIMKLHSIVRRPGGEIHGLPLSCKVCTSQEAMCDQCAALPPLYTPEADPADGEESEEEG